VQECQKDTYCFLFEPWDCKVQWQVVDRTAQTFGDCSSYYYSWLRVITLSHVEKTWKSSGGTEIQVVHSEFATSQCEYQWFLFSSLCHVCLLAPICLWSVTASDHLNVLHVPAFDGSEHLVSQWGDCLMAEANSLVLVVCWWAFKIVFCKSFKFNRSFNQFSVIINFTSLNVTPAYCPNREDSVFVRIPWFN